MTISKQVRSSGHPLFILNPEYFCDEAVSDEDILIKKPVFMAVAKYDYVCLRDFAITEIKKYAVGGLAIAEFDTGHFTHLEKPEEYNDALESWVVNTFHL